MSIGKWFVLGIWLLCIVGYLVVENPAVSRAAAYGFWFLVVAHAVECVIFQSRMRAAGGDLIHHVMQTMLFGIFHIRELPSGTNAA